MSTAVWTGVTATILYLIATIAVLRILRAGPVAGSTRMPVLMIGSLALLFHACALWHVLMQPDGLHLGLFPAASLIGATGALVVLVSSLFRSIELTAVMVFPFCMISIPAALWIQTGYAPHPLPHGVGVHVLLSVAAYAVLALAACQAVLVMVQHHQLKEGHIRGVMRIFPPIQVMESLLFELITGGIVLLTGAIISGFVFLDDLFAQHVAHKTILTLFSWLVFAILLTGRYFLGWRGVTAVRFTLGGFFLLLLAFFGTQLVLEVILDR